MQSRGRTFSGAFHSPLILRYQCTFSARCCERSQFVSGPCCATDTRSAVFYKVPAPKKLLAAIPQAGRCHKHIAKDQHLKFWKQNTYPDSQNKERVLQGSNTTKGAEVTGQRDDGTTPPAAAGRGLLSLPSEPLPKLKAPVPSVLSCSLGTICPPDGPLGGPQDQQQAPGLGGA